MSRDAEFASAWGALEQDWPKNERHLIHDSTARALGDLIRDFPEHIDTMISEFGESLSLADAKHLGLLWSCVLLYSPENNKSRNTERFLNYLDIVDPSGMRSLLVGVVPGWQRDGFFKESWPMVEKRWNQSPKFLSDTASLALVDVALKDPRAISLLEYVLDQTWSSSERTFLLGDKWVRGTTFYAPNRQGAPDVLSLILNQYSQDERSRALQSLFDDTCRLVQSLDEVRIKGGYGQETLHQLITAGANFYRISRSQYPKAWEVAQQHPRAIAARLGEVAGIDTEAHEPLDRPKRGM